MHRSLSHLGDRELLRDLATAVARERISTAEVLLLIAEVDARRLYLPAAYESMLAYCIGELGLSKDSALKRIRVARKAREYPKIFGAIEDGRLSLSSVVLLTPYLTREKADELVCGASGKTRTEIELFLAERFPRTEELGLVEVLPSGTPVEVAPGPVEGHAPTRVGTLERRRATGRVESNGCSVAIAPKRFAVHVTIGRLTQEKIERARSLLSHAVPSGDLGEVLDRALDALLAKLEKRKKAATSKPRAPRGGSSNPRSIPAHVRRAVFERDGDQCTFVSESGRRCEAHEFLELDHIRPVARGGASTLANLRLRCRAHNQMAADQAFGAEFMRRKRQERRAARSKDEAKAAEGSGTRTAKASPTTVACEGQDDEDLVPWLRALGYRPETARDAASRCGAVPGEGLEARMKRALSLLRPRASYIPAPAIPLEHDVTSVAGLRHVIPHNACRAADAQAHCALRIAPRSLEAP